MLIHTQASTQLARMNKRLSWFVVLRYSIKDFWFWLYLKDELSLSDRYCSQSQRYFLFIDCSVASIDHDRDLHLFLSILIDWQSWFLFFRIERLNQNLLLDQWFKNVVLLCINIELSQHSQLVQSQSELSEPSHLFHMWNSEKSQ